MRPLSPILGVVVVTALGCFPERDNPRDPLNAPHATIAVVDATGPGGGCMAVAGTASFPSIVTAGRGRCLVLDARATTDPQGDGLGFDFEVEGPAGVSVVVPAAAGDRIAVLGTAVRLAAGFVDVPLLARVHVTDLEQGGTSVAEAYFVLENGAPVADAGPMRSLPAGGFPWSPAETMSVTFDASRTTDPDGDDRIAGQLEYCWRFPEAPDVEQCDASPVVTHDVSTAVGGYVPRLRVRDGVAASRESSTAIHFQDPVVWVQQGQGVALLDSLRSDPGAVSAVPSASFGAFLPSEPPFVVISTTSGGDPVHLFHWPDLVPAHRASMSSSFHQVVEGVVAADSGDRDRFWFHGRGSDGQDPPGLPSLLGAFEAGSDGTVATLFLDDTSLFPDDGVPQRWVAGRDGLDGWAAVFGNSSLLQIDPISGATTEWPLGPLGAGSVLGLSARPASDAVWALAAGPSGGAFAVVLSGSPIQIRVIPLTAGPATCFVWSDADTFWVETEELGLVLADASLLLGGFSLEESALVRDPSFWHVEHVDPFTKRCDAVADPSSGGFAHATSDEVSLVDRRGVRRDVSALGVRPGFFDPRGGLHWRDFGTGLRVGRSLREDGIARAVEVLPRDTALDWTTGGVWVALEEPPFVRLVSGDGRIVREIREVFDDEADAVTPIPKWSAFRVSPDGSRAWGVSMPRGTFVLDLTREVPDLHLVLSSAGTAALGNNGIFFQAILEPSTPDGAFAWAVNRMTGEVVTVRGDGSGTDLRFTLPPDERFGGSVFAAAARSVVTDRLCMVTADDSAAQHHVRWIGLGGEERHEQEPLGAFFDHAVAVSGDAEDACWFARQRSGGMQLTALAPGSSGFLFDDVFTDISLYRMAAPRADQIWLVTGTPAAIRLDLNLDLDTIERRIDFGPTGDSLAPVSR